MAGTVLLREYQGRAAFGQIRAIDFVANAPGDWAIHCHKSHHTMNSMGHDVRTYIGADIKKAAERLKKLVPGYTPMGTDGMGMMGEMEMPGPDNTLPMMTGDGLFGPIEMGGMFTTVKVREGLSRGDFKDPGWYEHPRGTVAHDVKVDVVEEPVRPHAPDTHRKANLRAVKPGAMPGMKLMHE